MRKHFSLCNKCVTFASPGTAEALRSLDIPCTSLAKKQVDGPTAMSAIDEGKVDLVINIPVEYDELGRPDGYLIRRRAVDAGVPLLTDLQLARAVIEAAAQRADWHGWKQHQARSATEADVMRGHGLAWARYKNSGAWCAVVAEVEAGPAPEGGRRGRKEKKA